MTKNDSKIGKDIINLLMIALAVGTRFIGFAGQTLNMKVYVVLTSSALLVGAIYILYGRHESVDKYYRLFIVLFTIGSAAAIISPLLDVIKKSDSHGTVMVAVMFLISNIIVFMCGLILSIGGNYHKKFAVALAVIILLINLVKLIRAIIVVGTASYIAPNAGNFIMSYIICSFVKYRYERIEKEISETTI